MGNSSAKLLLDELTYVLFSKLDAPHPTMEVVTTFPDSVYLSSIESNPPFTGTVYVEKPNGKLVRSITYSKNGILLFDPELGINPSALKTFTICEFDMIYYTCTSLDHGDTWSCRETDRESIREACDDGNGSETNSYIPPQEVYDYVPETGTGTGDDKPSNIEEEQVVDCGEGFEPDGRGGCQPAVEPCITDDKVLDSKDFQESMKAIWDASNAADKTVPLNERRETGGWIVDNEGQISFIPFQCFVSNPCGMLEVKDWRNEIPQDVIGYVHSHPFYKGEDTRSVCCNENSTKVDSLFAKSYQNEPSQEDYVFLAEMMNETGKFFSLKAYVLDGDKISIIMNMLGDVKKHNRCGY